MSNQQSEKREKEKMQREIRKLKKQFNGASLSFTILCKECERTAITVSFEADKQRISVLCAGAREVEGTVSTEEFLQALQFARSKKFKDLNSFLHALTEPVGWSRRWLFDDGLRDFCKECNAAYCEEHYSSYPVFEEGGWYDCTSWECPKGHYHSVDD